MAIFAFCLFAAVIAPQLVFAESVSVTAVRDNTLFDDPSGALSNGAGSNIFCGNNGKMNTRRAVVAFDLASNIVSDATIDSVTLRLFVSSAPNDIPQRITLHTLLRDWGEGTSVSGGGAGAPSSTDDATWLHSFYPSQFWSSAGGDFKAAPTAEAVVGTSGHHYWSQAEMVADVQQWINAPELNFGWLLLGDESIASTVRRFDSHENDNIDNRPTLIIHYTIDTTPIARTNWGRIKQQYIQMHGGEP